MNAFENLGLEEPLVKAVTEMGYTTPTPIQEKSIPILLTGTTDFVGLAQTGTGKTAAFGLPLLQLVDEKEKYPQALIICPTRELCLQITTDLIEYAKYIRGMHMEAVYGGASIITQIKNLKKGVQIVIATPGRLIDLIERKAVDLNKVKYVVLDEADEMLNMGFRDDIDFVLGNTPNRESTWLFSATMPTEVRNIAKNYMNKPKEVTVGKTNSGNTNIDHQYSVTHANSRFEALKRIIDFYPDIFGIIFTRTKLEAQNIAEKLSKNGYDVEALHGDLSQQQRDRVMARFKNKTLQILVATDVAARGIDVDGVTHVINYELPDDLEVYTHRSGRTARAGKSGISLSIVHTREVYKIKHLEKFINQPFHKTDIPSGSDVCRKQFFHFMEKLQKVDISHGDFETYMPDISQKFEGMSKEEILTRIAALEFNQLIKYYELADDLNANDQKGDRSREGKFNKNESRNAQLSQNGFVKLFLNIGIKDGFYKASFLQFVLDESGLKKDALGKIDLKETSTWCEVDQNEVNRFMSKLNGQEVNNRTVRVEISSSGSGGSRRSGSSYTGGTRSRSSYGSKGDGNSRSERRRR